METNQANTNKALNLGDIKVGGSNKVGKTFQKFQATLEKGDYYQAHQIYRSVCNRFYNSKDYKKTIELLQLGALELLKYEQYASASDLGIYLLKAFEKAEKPCSNETITILKPIIYGFPTGEEARFNVITEAKYWSIKNSKYKFGNPLFHDMIGSLYAQENNYELAELYLIFGSSNTSAIFANVLFQWAKNTIPTNLGYFITRGVLSQLQIGNATSAIHLLQSFVKLIKENENIIIIKEENNFIETDLPLLNFSQLLIIILQKDGSKELFLKLKQHYLDVLNTEDYDLLRNVDLIGELYFGIPIYRPMNLMQTLMESMLFPTNSTQNNNDKLLGQDSTMDLD